MAFWQTLWAVLWFGGLAVFAVLAAVITVQGAKDLRILLRGPDADDRPAPPAGWPRPK